MKRLALFFFAISISIFPLNAVGFNFNLALMPGISSCIFGDQIEKSKYIWDNSDNFSNYISFGGKTTVDFILTQKISFEAGIEYKNINLNYLTKNGNEFANGEVNLNFSKIEIPVLFKYSVPLKKTTSVINSINLAAGPMLTYLTPNQSYSDALTTKIGNFIKSPFNVGLMIEVSYSHVIGPGKLLLGLETDVDFLKSKYSINRKTVSIGNMINFSPVIGYSFTLKEDKYQSKITEKNKRIKDIVVE